MTETEKVEKVRAILYRLRECECGEPPCPFCSWDWNDTDNSETGCDFVAREIVAALETPKT